MNLRTWTITPLLVAFLVVGIAPVAWSGPACPPPGCFTRPMCGPPVMACPPMPCGPVPFIPRVASCPPPMCGPKPVCGPPPCRPACPPRKRCGPNPVAKVIASAVGLTCDVIALPFRLLDCMASKMACGRKRYCRPAPPPCPPPLRGFVPGCGPFFMPPKPAPRMGRHPRMMHGPAPVRHVAPMRMPPMAKKKSKKPILMADNPDGFSSLW